MPSLTRRPRTLLICLLLATTAVAADDPLDESWRWTSYDEDSGLPSRLVRQVIEAHPGEEWAISDSGLAWFDGWEWHPLGNDGGLGGRTPHSLSAQSDGRLVTVVDGRLYRSRGKRFEPVEVTSGGQPLQLVQAAPLGAWAGSGAILLLASRRAGEPELYRLAAGRIEPVPVSVSLAGARLWPTRSGAVWLQLPSGLYRLGPAGLELRLPARRCCRTIGRLLENASGSGIAGILFPPEERGLWVWEEGSLPARDPSTGSGLVAALGLDPTGDATAVFEGGEVLVRRHGVWSTLASVPDTLRNVRDLGLTQSGDAWAATESGLHYFRGSSRRWTRWKQDVPSARNRVHALLRARDGAVWVATAAGIEVHRQDGSIDWFDHAGTQALVDVTGLGEDRTGGIWAVSGNSFTGAYRLAGGAWRHFGAEQGLAAGYVHRITADRQGRLWFLTLTRGSDHADMEGAGAFVWDGARFEAWGAERGMPAGRLYAMAEAGDGALWFAWSRGLLRFRADRWTSWSEANGLRLGRVFTVAAGGDRLWFGDQNNGLGSIGADDRPSYLTTQDGLPQNEVWELAMGDDGRLWIATHGGLASYQDGSFAAFGSRVGLDHPRLWPLLVDRGRIFAGTAGGGTYILDLESDRGWKPPRLRVHAAAVQASGATSVLARWSVLPWRGEAPPDRYRTRYRVDGGEWSSWSGTREVTIDAPAPGEHQLEAQALGFLGRPVLPAARATFAVAPPLWRRTAFALPIAALSIAVMALATGLVGRRVRHVQELRRSEERYRSLFEEASDLMCTVGAEGQFVAVNQAWERATGWTRAELTGRPFADAVAPEFRAPAGELIGAARASGSVARQPSAIVEVDLAGRDGSRIPVEMHVRRLSRSNGEKGSLELIGRDLTERRQAEAERLRLERQVLEVQKLESLGVLAGGVAHDFNNLLLAMLGNADLARDTLPPSSPARDHLERIATAATRAGDLTQQLLAYTGKGRVVLEIVDLGQLAREMADLLRVSLPLTARLVLELDPATRPVEADAGRMRQVLMNLILNAGESAGAAPVTVTVRTRPEPLAHGERVVLEVEDTGAGMAPELLSRVFDPFFTTKFAGRGLGLAAVQGIIRTHRGSIDVRSEVGKGTTFTVRLPAALEPGTSATPTAPAFAGSGAVLVVDDEEPALRVTAQLVGAMGFAALTASDGRQALELFREHGDEIRLVVLDLLMPGMSGEVVLRELRRIRPGVPVILISGYDEGEARRRGASGERVTFLGKPFGLHALTARIRDLLG